MTALLLVLVVLAVVGVAGGVLLLAVGAAGARRGPDELQRTLDGLQTAYQTRIATLEAQREISRWVRFGGGAATALPIHLPPAPSCAADRAGRPGRSGRSGRQQPGGDGNDDEHQQQRCDQP